MHELFKKRRSVRDFQEKEITDFQIKQILTAAMVAPSGRHACPWEFILVKDPKTKDKLSKLRRYGRFIKDAPIAIVIVGKEKESNLWVQDCSLAAGHIYLEATNQGLGTCWVNIKDSKTDDGKDAEQAVKEILGIPDDLRVLCIMPIGHPRGEVQPHTEEEYRDEIVHREKW